MAEEFRLRSVAVAVYAPATLFGLAEGSMLPVVVLSAIERGATTSVAALVSALIGIGSLIMNIPAGVLATRVGERKSMLLAAGVSAAGLVLCLLRLGPGVGPLVVYGAGVLMIGSAGAVYSLARQSYLTEVVPLHIRARALSTLGGTMRVGLFAGPFLGAAAMQVWGTPGAYYVSLVAVLAAGVVVYRVPDLETTEEVRAAAAAITTWGMIKKQWRVYATLGAAILLLSAIRQTRQTVVPLWAAHLGLSPTASSVIYGFAGAVDALVFYPAGKVMDHYGRRWVAVPCAFLLGASFVLMPMTHGALLLAIVAMVMGFGNGIGSGIIMTLGADVSPAIGRPTHIGIWNELGDIGAGLGPLLLAAVTALAGLGPGIVVSGFVGFGAASALWTWIPRTVRRARRAPARE